MSKGSRNFNKILLLVIINILCISCQCPEGKIQTDAGGSCLLIPALMKRGTKLTAAELDYLSSTYKGTKIGKFIVTVHKLPTASDKKIVIPKDVEDISVIEMEGSCLSTILGKLKSEKNMNGPIYFFLIEQVREAGFENSYINVVKYFLKEPENKEVILPSDSVFKECKNDPMRLKHYVDFRKAEGFFHYIKYGEEKRNLADQQAVTVINMNDIVYAKEEYNVDFFDLTSQFFTDICFKYETDNGANLPLNLRKQLYNMNCSFCENSGEDTYYEGFEYDKEKDKFYAKCLFHNKETEAQIQNKLDQIDQTLNKVIKSSNFNVVKCSQHVFDFSFSAILKNYGEIICIVCIFLQIIFLLVFIIAGTTGLREIVFGFIDKAEDKIEEIYEHRLPSQSNCKDEAIHIDSKERCVSPGKSNNEFIYKSRRKRIGANPPPKTADKNCDKNSDKSSEVSDQVFELNDEEMDQLSLEKAIKHDTRGFCETYCYYLKKSQLIWFTFFNSDDYNSFVVKFSLFVFQLPMLLAINAFFYTDEDLSAVNLEIEKLEFKINKENIIRALISSILGFIILFVLKGLCLSHSGVEAIRHEKEIEKARKMAEGYFFSLRCKIFIYFVVSSCLLLAFSYFITAFCAIFPAVFTSLAYDTVISLGISLLYPFVVCWFAAFCRKIGMCCNCCFFYNFGKLLACF